MIRIAQLLGGVLFAGLCALILLNFAMNPLGSRADALAQQLRNVETSPPDTGSLGWNFDAWHASIMAKPKLWEELVPPPPPPPPPPEQPPNLKDKLKGVTPLKAQIGDRIKIRVPSSPKGALFGVGDNINGLALSEITKDSVVFTFEWKGQQLKESLPRE